MYGLIYLVTNKINNKKYIGQTTMTLAARWNRHCSRARTDENPTGLHGAIKKYGEENFIVRIIELCETKEELDRKEVFWIKYYDTFRGEGYNRSLGGEGLPILDLPETEIAKEYQNTDITMQGLADKYGCCKETISTVLKRQGVPPKVRPGVQTEQQKINLAKGRIGGRAENLVAYREKLKKKICIVDEEGNEVLSFGSLSDACRYIGQPTNHTNRLSKAAAEGKLYGGYRWKLS